MSIDTFRKQESGQKIIFALYHKDSVSDKTLHDLINMNFETFLNVDESSDKLYQDTELVFDDDSVHEHQQELSRVYGGGRRIMLITMNVFGVQQNL